MNFENIYLAQKKLDQKILKNVNFENIDNKNECLFLALLTEIGELANEIQTFKYWKKNKNLDKNKILEEYADGLHFLVSFAITFNLENIIDKQLYTNDNINKQFLFLYSLINDFYKNQNKENLRKCISCFLGIAFLCKIDENEIEKAYMEKNLKNHLRMENNY